MKFEQSEFKSVLKEVGDQFGYGAMDVFFIDGKIGKNDLHFTYNSFEEQQLYRENHYESHLYVGWDVRAFYEHLMKIQRGVLSQEEYLYSNYKSKVMQEKPADFAEGQLKRVGMLEALTPELKNKLAQSTGSVEHSFGKQYDNDQVNVNLHFRKSRTSDLSFLNKFDMTLKKEGQEGEMKQTFYTPPEYKLERNQEGQQIRYDNKYTMKEAYNLLSGRPVFKNLLSKEGNGYQAWIRMDRSKVQENGNHELKPYNQNYGFNLDNVLKQYSIKELANDQHYKNLVSSLQRGNLQKATFVGKDGKEESLYISPSLKTSSLNVYDSAGKRVPLEKLVSDGHISQSLVDNLKEKFGQKQQQGAGQSVLPATDRPEVNTQQVNQRTSEVKEQQPKAAKKQRKRIKVK